MLDTIFMSIMNPDEPRNTFFCISGTIVRLYLNTYQLYHVLMTKAATRNAVVMIKMNILCLSIINIDIKSLLQSFLLQFQLYFFQSMPIQDNPQEQIHIEDIQKKLKVKIFEAVKNYLEQCQNLNPIFIYLLIFIQSLQILWFSIHPLLQFLDNQFIISYVRATLSYINFQSSLVTDSKLLLPFVLLVSAIMLIHVITIILSLRQNNLDTKKQTQFGAFINKVAAIQIVLLNTILTIPIYNLSIITLYCDPESYYYKGKETVCYNTSHIILCILSSISLFILLSQSLLYWFLFFNRNPFSKSYYGLANNLFRLGKLAIKLIPPAYFIIEFKFKFENVYVFMMLVLMLAYIVFFRINSIHNFYQPYFYFQLYMESLILWFFINNVICYEMPSSGMNFVQSCLCSLLFAYTVCTVEAAITKYFIVTNIDGNIKKQDREKFIYLLINILFREGSSQQINPIVYIKLLNSSLNICSIKISKYLHKNDLKTQELIELTRQLILLLTKKFIQESPSVNLKIVGSRILFDSGMRILSFHEINEIRNDKLSLYEEFMIYHFKSTHQIFGQSETKSNQQNISEINTYLEYIQNMNQFQNELQACAKNNEQFWEQLCEDIPSMNKVFNLSKRSIKYATKIQETFKKIEQIYPQNLTVLLLYYQFLNDVSVNHRQFNKIKQKWNNERQRQRNMQNLDLKSKQGKIKFRANEKMCVMQIATSSNAIGIVVNCNSQVKKYLGYDKSELLNQKITKIMPKIYGQIHDDFIRQYLLKADYMQLPVQKTVFAFKKNFRMIETSLAVKIFPNFLCGFQLVGFFKQKNQRETSMNLIVNMKTFQIEGMTQGFIKMAGNKIKLTQIQKEPLKLSHLFPQIEANHDFSNNEEIKTVFRFSDCTDKLIEVDDASYQSGKNFDRTIILSRQSIKYYKQIQIATFQIRFPDEQVSLQDTSLNHYSSNLVDRRTKLKKEKNNHKNDKKSGDDANHDQSAIERKIHDYINSKSHITQMCLIKVIFIVSFITLTMASIFVNVYESTLNSEHLKIFDEIELSKNISILEGQVLINNECIVNQASNQTQWEQDKTFYLKILKQLQISIISLFEKASIRKGDNLVINEYQTYNFKTLYKNNSQPQVTSLFYLDGVLQTIFLAFDYLKKNMTSFVKPVSQQILQSTYFIQQNMKKMLPDIAMKTTEAYNNLFAKSLQNQFYNEIYFVTSKTITFLILFLVTYCLLKKFTKFNMILVQVYNNILKWNAHQLYSKCSRFRYLCFQANNSVAEDQVPRNEDILKVFPKGLLIKLTEGFLNMKNEQSQHKTSIFSQVNKRVSFSQNQDDQASKLNKKPAQPQSIFKKGDLINISYEDNLNKKFILMFILLLGVICINFSFLFYKQSLKSKLFQQRDNTINIGKYQKSFIFTFYYGRTLFGGNSQIFQLYANQLDSFYSISRNVSYLIGDPLNYLRQVYTQIQTVNSIVKDELMGVSKEKKQQYIKSTQQKLYNISEQISKLSTKRSSEQVANIKSVQKIISILKIGVDVILTLIFCYLMQIHLMRAVENQLEHSRNMMKMVPVWIVNQSNVIKNIMFNKDYQFNARKQSVGPLQNSGADFLQKDNI